MTLLLLGVGKAPSEGGGPGPFSPADLAPEIWIDPSDLGTLFQELTGASATVPAGVGDLVGTIANKGALGGYAVATDFSTRMVLRQDGNGKYYLEQGTGRRYVCAFSNTAGARSSCIGVRGTGQWAMSQNDDPSNADAIVFSDTMYLAGGSNRLYTASPPSTASPGAVIHTLTGGGVTPPRIWRNGSEQSAPSDLAARTINTTILSVFSFWNGSANDDAAYYGYVSKFADIGGTARAQLDAWMAEQMGITI